MVEGGDVSHVVLIARPLRLLKRCTICDVLVCGDGDTDMWDDEAV